MPWSQHHLFKRLYSPHWVVLTPSPLPHSDLQHFVHRLSCSRAPLQQFWVPDPLETTRPDLSHFLESAIVLGIFLSLPWAALILVSTPQEVLAKPILSSSLSVSVSLCLSTSVSLYLSVSVSRTDFLLGYLRARCRRDIPLPSIPRRACPKHRGTPCISTTQWAKAQVCFWGTRPKAGWGERADRLSVQPDVRLGT